MYAKFFKAAERRKRAQALAEENKVLPSVERQSHEDHGTQLKKSVPSEFYNSCDSDINVNSEYSNSTEMNLSKMMENLHISKHGTIKTNIMFLRERELPKSSTTGNDGEHMEISPSVSSKIAIETETKNENGMKPLKNFTNSCMSDLTKRHPGHSVLVDPEVLTSVDTIIGTNTHDPTKVIKNSLNGSKSKMEGIKMKSKSKNLDHMNKVPLGTNEKERERKHMFPTEGNKIEPTEVMEKRIYGSKQKKKPTRMVQMGLRKGNLAESSTMPPKNPSDGQHIFQTEPKYVSSKNTSEAWLQGTEWPESHVDVTKTQVSQYDRERMRTDLNKLVQKRNPEVREITNTLEQPSLFDKLVESVNDMNYNGGKNPVSVLNELIPNLEYHIEKSGPQHLPNFKVSINIDGQNYCGVGNTKKAAKMNTAVLALKGIGSNKTSSTSSRTLISKNVKSTYISSNQRSELSTSSSRDQLTSITTNLDRILPRQALNAVSTLNNLRKGLKYQCVAINGPSHIPNFKVSVRADNKVYYGIGRSKKLAKANAARKALMCINRETDNWQGSLVGLKSIKTKSNVDNTSNVTTTSANKQFVAVSVPKGKPPFAVLNDLYPNPEVSWTGRNSNGNVSFTISLEGRKFTGVGLNLKSAKNNAAIRALHDLRGFSPTSWEIH